MRAQILINLVSSSKGTDQQTTEALHQALEKDLEIRASVQEIYDEMNSEEMRFRKRMDTLESRLINIQENCPHFDISKDEDPSGGSDVVYSCDACQKTQDTPMGRTTLEIPSEEKKESSGSGSQIQGPNIQRSLDLCKFSAGTDLSLTPQGGQVFPQTNPSFRKLSTGQNFNTGQ